MKKRFLNRDRILYFVVMILSVLFLYVGNRIAVQDNSYFQSSRADTYYRAEVIAVGEPQQIENTYDGWSESYIGQSISSSRPPRRAIRPSPMRWGIRCSRGSTLTRR